MNPACPNARETADSVRSGRATACDVIGATFERIQHRDPELHAFLQTFPGEARQAAERVDATVARGDDPGPLAGVPVAIKDNMCLSYGRTTCASRMLETYKSPFSATAVQRLEDAGAIIVGKTNLDEFAMGSSCEHSAFGPTRNPWDTHRVPGGSSGGSAAAVASGMVPIALGSDTGGSIRQPAGLCGIVGLKPTYGRVSRWGLVAFASSLDQIGPLTNTVDDAALVLSVISGFDPLDSTSSRHELPDPSDVDAPDLSSITIGIPKQAFSEANHDAVTSMFEASMQMWRDLGASLVEVDLAHTSHAIAAYYIVAPAEASSNLARFDGIRYGRRAALQDGEGLEDLYCRSRAEGFGAEVQRRIMLGTHALSSGYYDAYYTTALRVRRRISEEYSAAFNAGCDAIMLPATPGPAFRLGEKINDPLSLYQEDVYTVGANLAGLPGITVPREWCEVDGSRLPLGVQLIGPAWDESRLLLLARNLEGRSEFRAHASK